MDTDSDFVNPPPKYPMLIYDAVYDVAYHHYFFSFDHVNNYDNAKILVICILL